MRQIGRRKQPPVMLEPSASNLATGIAFSLDMVNIAGGHIMFPKGVFRYKSHAQANAHEAHCLAEGMAKLARNRTNG